MFSIFATASNRIPNIIFFGHTMLFWIFTLGQHLSLFRFWFELHFLPSNLHLHSHDICFVNAFDAFVLLIILKALRFKSAVLFGTYYLLDKSLRVLQLPAHLSKLTENG